MTLSELTARFWSAAKYSRRAPEKDQQPAQKLLREVARIATGTLQQRAQELIKEDENGTGTSYPG